VQEPLIIPKDNGWAVLMSAIKGEMPTAKYVVPQEAVSVDNSITPVDTLFSESLPVDDLFANTI
jgi:hypothetical protein